MLEGFYTAASGMLMQQRALDVLTNNMVNAKTPGYRANRVISTTFEHEFMTRMEQYNTGRIGVAAPIRIVAEVPTRFDPNSLEETGRPFDFALNGPGFFNIQGGTEEEPQQYLTRNGNFDLDEEGNLILRGAGKVLGTRGVIQIGTSNFTVEYNGDVYDERGRLVDTLLITEPAEGAELTAQTNGMYQTEDMEANQTIENPMVVQGWLERSNVDFNREYTLVMEAQRAFQACSTALQILDKVNQKSAAQIASVG